MRSAEKSTSSWEKTLISCTLKLFTWRWSPSCSCHLLLKDLPLISSRLTSAWDFYSMIVCICNHSKAWLSRSLQMDQWEIGKRSSTSFAPIGQQYISLSLAAVWFVSIRSTNNGLIDELHLHCIQPLSTPHVGLCFTQCLWYHCVESLIYHEENTLVF